MKKIVEGFIPQGGKHCITNALKQLFTFHGYPLTEEMMFGLASGLSFLYLNQSQTPMLCGRSKIFDFEKKLADRLHITIKCKSGKQYKNICQRTINLIKNDTPVLIYTDMPYLPYLGMDEDSHFGGHAVVLYGYDDSQEKFWISDRDNHDHPVRTPTGAIAEDYHLVSFHEIEQARNSSHRPFPANNKYLVLDFDGYRGINKEMLSEAITETCDIMLNPPANLLGVNGILKFSKEVLKWKNFPSEKLKRAGTINYFQISKDGGTGGGIFRKMYGQFLAEASDLLNNKRVSEIGEEFVDVADQWDAVADYLWELSLHGDVKLLNNISELVQKIYVWETSLYQQLKTIAAPNDQE